MGFELDIPAERRQPSAFSQVDPGDLGSNTPLVADWGGWIRTSECESQSLVSCRLTTPHRRPAYPPGRRQTTSGCQQNFHRRLDDLVQRRLR